MVQFCELTPVFASRNGPTWSISPRRETMKRDMSHRRKTALAASSDFDLGTWLGRRQAFSMIAGRASAADAECLRRIREQKLYRSRTAKWPEFCVRYVGASKTNVDRMIRQLEEFGPPFFQLAQLTRISPETYRAIAPQVGQEGLRFEGEAIALVPENAEKVSAAVAEMRRRAARNSRAEGAGSTEFAALQICFRDVLRRLKRLPAPLKAGQKVSIAEWVAQLRESAARLGVKV